jgi:CRP-like cAMP-binding protein
MVVTVASAMVIALNALSVRQISQQSPSLMMALLALRQHKQSLQIHVAMLLQLRLLQRQRQWLLLPFTHQLHPWLLRQLLQLLQPACQWSPRTHCHCQI